MNSKLVSIVLFSLVLSSCIVNKPKDLTVQRSMLVKPFQVEKMLSNGKNIPWISGDFLMVELSTETDLYGYADKEGKQLAYAGRFCDELETPVKKYGLFSINENPYLPFISFKNTNIDGPSGNLFSYFVFVPVSFSKDVEIWGRPNREGAIFYKKYNLNSSSGDICFKVGAYSYGSGFESNTARLFRYDIEESLKDAVE